MNQSSLKWLLASGVFVALAGCAGTPNQSQDALVQDPAKSAQATEQPNCLRETGSRLPPAEGRCLASAGRVVEREELERTGAISTGEALKRLLPF